MVKMVQTNWDYFKNKGLHIAPPPNNAPDLSIVHDVSVCFRRFTRTRCTYVYIDAEQGELYSNAYTDPIANQQDHRVCTRRSNQYSTCGLTAAWLGWCIQKAIR